MTISKVYLDDDHNVVSPDLATQAVVTETDDQGNLVGERWLRIAVPGSLAADRIAIEENASRMAATRRGRKIPFLAIAFFVLVVTAVILTFALS